MATIIPNKKKGKIVAFKFRAYVGQNQLRYLQKTAETQILLSGGVLIMKK